MRCVWASSAGGRCGMAVGETGAQHGLGTGAGLMQIDDFVLGLAAGTGIALSPDGKTACYVEQAMGELSQVEMATGKVTTVATGLADPVDVEIDWQTGEIF